MSIAAAIEDRCDRCTRDDLLTVAVVEAARRVMFWHLKEERNLPEYLRTIPTMETQEALQELRDALFAERRARG